MGEAPLKPVPFASLKRWAARQEWPERMQRRIIRYSRPLSELPKLSGASRNAPTGVILDAGLSAKMSTGTESSEFGDRPIEKFTRSAISAARPA